MVKAIKNFENYLNLVNWDIIHIKSLCHMNNLFLFDGHMAI